MKWKRVKGKKGEEGRIPPRLQGKKYGKKSKKKRLIR